MKKILLALIVTSFASVAMSADLPKKPESKVKTTVTKKAAPAPAPVKELGKKPTPKKKLADTK